MSVLSWSPLKQLPEGRTASGMWLMQDGSVLANFLFDTPLMVLRPDGSGSYADGSWTAAGNFLAPKADYAAAVLSDGRLVTCGGEYYGTAPKDSSNFCEIYDPTTQESTALAPPPGWNSIADSPSAVLSDGRFLLGNTQGWGYQIALLNPSTLTWAVVGTVAVPTGDQDNEQTYTLMQTGDVLTTGVYNPTSMRYNSTANAFVPDAPIPVMLGADTSFAGPETGPALSLMDGRVICFGATGHTCIYTPGGTGEKGSWVQGPDLPVAPNGEQLIAADVPAILEPNGSVLVVAVPSGDNTTMAFVEYRSCPKHLLNCRRSPHINRHRTKFVSKRQNVVTSKWTWACICPGRRLVRRRFQLRRRGVLGTDDHFVPRNGCRE